MMTYPVTLKLKTRANKRTSWYGECTIKDFNKIGKMLYKNEQNSVEFASLFLEIFDDHFPVGPYASGKVILGMSEKCHLSVEAENGC